MLLTKANDPLLAVRVFMSEELIERVEFVRNVLGFSLIGMSREIGIPDATYRDWVHGRRKLVSSSLLRNVLFHEGMNPFFTFILTGGAPLVQQYVLLGAEEELDRPQDVLFESPEPVLDCLRQDVFESPVPVLDCLSFDYDDLFRYGEGFRLKLVREYLGFSRAELLRQLPEVPITTFKNYERMTRRRIPCSFYDVLLSHRALAPYVLYILFGGNAQFLEQTVWSDNKTPCGKGYSRMALCGSISG